MAKYALKQIGTENILSIIEWDGVSSYTPPSGYEVELLQSNETINYYPEEIVQYDPVYAGRLFGSFEGALNGEITINGKPIDELIHETSYGSLTLYSSSLSDFNVASGSFKIESDSIKLPLNTRDNNSYYSSTLQNVVNQNIKNYTLRLKSKLNPFAVVDFIITDTKITGSISGGISRNYYLLSTNEIANNIKTTANPTLDTYYDDFYGTEWHADFKYDLVSQNKIQIDIISGSQKFVTPVWAKSLTVIAIGGGGAGGGGVVSLPQHHIAVGGAGGGGGNISYMNFTNISSSLSLQCFIGRDAVGGNTGSQTASVNFGNLENQPLSYVFNKDISKINFSTFVSGSSGENGFPTIVYVFGKDAEIKEIYAAGGIGGLGGFSFSILSGSLQPILTGSMLEGYITSSLSQPYSLSGGSNISAVESKGETILGGGPGGYGIALPVKSTGTDKYSNSAPSLPWGIRTGDSTDPYNFNDGGLLKLPFGVRSNKNDLNYEKPSEIAPTGGGGGNGWVTSSLEVTSSITIGTGGKLNKLNKLFGYEISTGGNGGNRSTKNSLSITLPTTGSGPGAGGGGGASDYHGGSAQNGANGNKGVVVVISRGI
jgi:hypothetical protein